MTITVRPLARQDWPALWPLLQGVGVNEEPSEAHRDRYAGLVEDPRWVVLGAFTGDELVGYAAVQDHGPHLRFGDDERAARLHDLYVHPGRRRAGVGRALLVVVTQWAGQRVRYLEWQAHHERAAPFYERLGYHGDPCPQPEYPTFEVDFRAPSS